MIELLKQALHFSFPEVHPQARFHIDFQRTLRIPDDDRTYPLPPGLGCFPVQHVDDFAAHVPDAWMQRGGVMLPMYQSEALWLNFSGCLVADRHVQYPIALKVATGKINAISGAGWSRELSSQPQDYMVIPEQPWLDGYCVERGTIRQFVAMPLGDGYSAEEQLTGEAEFGGIQLLAYPMKREVFERRFPVMDEQSLRFRSKTMSTDDTALMCAVAASPSMGLAPGGCMKQEIYDDPYDPEDWDMAHGSRCFVHLTNSLVWQSITGKAPPTTPPTAKQYTKHGLPWFDYYRDGATPLPGSKTLGKLKSVVQMAVQKGTNPLPENESVEATNVKLIRAGLGPHQVRESEF